MFRTTFLVACAMVAAASTLSAQGGLELPISFMLQDPMPADEGAFGMEVHMVDLNGDGEDDLIVGAPGKNTVIPNDTPGVGNGEV